MERRKVGLVTPLTDSGRSPLPEMEYGEEVENNEPDANTSLIQQLMEATAEAAKGQRELITEQREVEKAAPMLKIITRSEWIKFKALYKAYQFKKGTYSIVRQIDQEHHDFCATFICNISVPEFLYLDNDVISKCFDKHFAVITASGYEEVLQTLYMPISSVFDRSAIDIYSQQFLATLLKNPTFENPSAGGTSKKNINKLFLLGIQPEHFRLQIEKYDTENVIDTFRAIVEKLPIYQISADMGMAPITLIARTPPHAALKTPTSNPPTARAPFKSPITIPCFNCNKVGHHHTVCTQNCLHCVAGTPAHKYFDKYTCKHRVAFYKKRQEDKRRTKALSAVASGDIASQLAAARLEIVQLKAAKEVTPEGGKKIYLDSAANKCIIADINHIDPHTSPSYVRNEEHNGVETANGALLAVEGTGQIAGVKALICPESSATLLSLGQVLDELDASCLVTSSEARVFKNSPDSVLRVNDFNNHVTSTHTGILTATRNSDLMYEITLPIVPSVVISPPEPVLGPVLAAAKVSAEPSTVALDIATVVTGALADIADWRPSASVLETHRIAYGAYYHLTAELPRLRDLVRFFHEAWDHPSCDLMCKIVTDKMFTSIPDELTPKVIRKFFPACEACPAANMAQRDIPREASDREFVPGEEIQIDIKIWANSSKALKHRRAFGKHIGAVTAVDMATRYKIGKLIKTTSDLEVQLEELRVEIRGTGHTLKVLRMDNQFYTKAVKNWAARCEPYVELQPCIPHEHHSIGDIERFHRTLEDTVFKKLYGKPHLSVQYWGMAYSDYIMKANMMGSVHGPTVCPYELWHGRKPDLLKLPMIPFGSVVMAHVPLDQQTTDGPRSILHYAVGTSLGHRGGLRLFNPKTKREVIRRTYKVLGPAPQPYTTTEYEISEEGDVKETSVSVDTSKVSGNVDDYKYLVGTMHRDSDDLELYKTISVVAEEFEADMGPIIVAYRRRVTETGALLPVTEDDEYPYQIQDIVQDTADYALVQPAKISKKAAVQVAHHVRAYAIKPTVGSRSPSKPAVDWTRRLPRSIADLLTMPESNPDRAGFLAATTSEIASLRDMKTWDPEEALDVEQMKTSKIGMSRCVFTKKYHPDGTFDKYKCRIVFRGDRWYDLYCNKTYAGCVMSETVRLMLSVAATEDMEIGCLDVKTAFLYGDVPEDQYIYMRRPAGLTDADMPAVVRLRKCLYGLPHAPATFRRHSDDTLRSLGFKPTVSDPRLYVRLLTDGTKAYVAVHVDDFGIAASTVALKEEVMATIQEVYRCVESDLGFYLGMKLVRDRVAHTITVSQPGYMEDLREDFGITSTSGPLTPMVDKEREPESDTNPPLDAAGIKLYQSKVGSALWPAIGTRPDVQLAINLHSRYTKSPLRGDMVTLDRLIEYLVHTPDLGLVLGGHGGVILYATVDASYGTHADRKSHTGCTLHIGVGSGAFLSRSKKQTVTADSSTVAEFIATHLASKEVMWARALLSEMGHPQLQPTVLGEDNMSTIAMIQNDCNGQKTKHIAIRFNMIRELVQQLEIAMEHLPTADMTSDILTKPLDPKPFLHLRRKLLGMMVLQD